MNEQEIKNLVSQILREELDRRFGVGKFVLQKELQLMDGRNIQVGKTTGTKIGTETTQKIGFFGETPVVQQSAISDPSGGATQDANARTAINAILDLLQAYGLMA